MGKAIKRAGKDILSLTPAGQGVKMADEVLNPDVPTIEEPDVAPVADDQAISLANKRKAAKRRQGGRAGTILTEGSKLG